LNKKDFLISLKNKFIEEIEELNLENKEEAIKELADLQLIIDICLKTLDIDKKEFKEIGKNKNKKVGKFDKKIYVKTVELDEKDEWFDYYVRKYKEIK
jgi:predicted house-cleaning noncanonical NTP pyrophosphatase (MazG superfamily)